MFKRLLLTISLLLLTACNTTLNTKQTNIPLTFKASAYNSIANQYIERPTFASMFTKENGNNWINIIMETYGKNEIGLNSISIAFLQSEIPNYVLHIDKYLEWESKASKDGDIIKKKIGSAKTSAFSIDFTFFSGNSSAHYLSIGMPGTTPQYFSRTNAEKLKELLIEFKNGNLKPIDLNTKYN